MTQSKEAKVLYYASPAAMIKVFIGLYIVAAFCFTYKNEYLNYHKKTNYYGEAYRE